MKDLAVDGGVTVNRVWFVTIGFLRGFR